MPKQKKMKKSPQPLLVKLTKALKLSIFELTRFFKIGLMKMMDAVTTVDELRAIAKACADHVL